MAENSYMVCESTHLGGARIFSLQAEKDIQNGAIVGKGDLIDGETSIYEALDDYTDDEYLVLNPAWSYDDSSVVNQNEENYINVADKPFRAYKLAKDMKFKIYNIDETFSVGDAVQYDAATGQWVSGGEEFKVVAIEEVGFPYCVGSYGVKVPGDTENKYGYALGEVTTKYTIEKIA